MLTPFLIPLLIPFRTLPTLAVRGAPVATLTILIAMLTACQTSPPAPPVAPPVHPTLPLSTEQHVPTQASYKLLDYSAIPGWKEDKLNEALPAFQASCKVLERKSDWMEICHIAKTVDGNDPVATRKFFEAFFNPYQIINPDGTQTGLITGYYEPLLRGARKRGGLFQTPLYSTPSDLLSVELSSVYPELKGMRLRGKLSGNKVIPFPARAELLKSGELTGKEICWVDDSVDAFFLQVQGSGRVKLADSKETIRLAYADQNGYPYKSIGRYLVDKGELKLEQASAQSIKSWILANPTRHDEVLNSNPSYVFFKEEKLADPKQGPKGSLGVALTEKRSIAIDTQFIPMGIPVFLDTTEPNKSTPLQRLMIAQDTGGAIRGAVRADFFWGFGDVAAEMSGRMKQRGMLWILWPKLAKIAPEAAVTGR